MIAAEWLKLRSIRSSHLLLGLSLAAIPLAVAVAWSAIGMYDSATPAMRRTARIAELEEVVLIVPQLCMGIMGVLAITSEYATGLIRTSLALVPRRWPVLTAKSAVVGGLGLVVGPVVVFATYAVTAAMLDGRFPVAPLAERWPTLVASSVTVAVFALLGLGLGAVLRSAAGAIAVLVGLVYVIPIVVGNLPEPWSERLGSVMIGALPREITGADLTSSVYGALLPPVVAGVVLALYAVAPVAAGLLLLRHRDA
ncbi:ABC transporter permease [Nonomuraea sp. NPDC059194]|uniref:ABC transporter permease n=1 Tax=Nonomuraea sp. NPDC059194 TaxID=3346764 RepID=UPI003677DC18